MKLQHEQIKIAHSITKGFKYHQYAHIKDGWINANNTETSYLAYIGDDELNPKLSLNISKLAKAKGDFSSIAFCSGSDTAFVASDTLQLAVEAQDLMIAAIDTIGATQALDSLSIDSANLIDAISCVKHCASKDSTRFSINGVYYDVNKQRFVATNGHCLAVKPLELAIKDSFFLPLDSLDTILMFLKRHASIVFETRTNPVEIKNAATGEVTIRNDFEMLRLVSSDNLESLTIKQERDFRYPDYLQVIPNQGLNLLLDRCEVKSLINKIKLLEPTIEDKSTTALKLDISSTGNLTISVKQSSVSLDTFPMGNPMTFGINYEKLMRCLKNMQKQRVEFFDLWGSDEVSPFKFVLKDKVDTFEIIMPMRFE